MHIIPFRDVKYLSGSLSCTETSIFQHIFFNSLSRKRLRSLHLSSPEHSIALRYRFLSGITSSIWSVFSIDYPTTPSQSYYITAKWYCKSCLWLHKKSPEEIPEALFLLLFMDDDYYQKKTWQVFKTCQVVLILLFVDDGFILNTVFGQLFM